MTERQDPFAAKLLAFLRAGRPGPVQALEVGCGDGQAGRLLRRHLASRHDHPATRLCLLDLSLGNVRQAERGLAAAGPGCHALAGDLYALPFPDASFDYVFGFNVLYWVERRRFFREARRVLKPDGRMLTCDRLPEQLAAPLPYMFWEMTHSRLGELDLTGAG